MEHQATKLRIKELCKEKGVNQKDLAPVLGISATSLSTAIQEGRLNIRQLERIADTLGVGVPELFAGGSSGFRCPNCGALLEVSVSRK